jgi:hypothetical protein
MAKWNCHQTNARNSYRTDDLVNPGKSEIAMDSPLRFVGLAALLRGRLVERELRSCINTKIKSTNRDAQYRVELRGLQPVSGPERLTSPACR